MPDDPRKPRAVFLDRDGTLMQEAHYCSQVQNVRVFAEVPAALQRLKNAGFRNIIITNQAGIGRGIFTIGEYRAVEREVLRQIGPGLIDGTYFCPDHPDRATSRRKPGIGMIEEARRDHDLALDGSWFIGDKAIDIACGRAAGLGTILVETGYGASEKCDPDFRVPDFPQAVNLILKTKN